MLSRQFNLVVCVFMYIVPDMEYENRYIAWAERNYKNCRFIKTPHYSVYSFIKYGYLGIKKDPSMSKTKISIIDEKIKDITLIEWSVYGFKKIDGLTRRFMLNDCPDGLHHTTKKAYPIMDFKNKDCLRYIADNNLITPFNYNIKKPSSGSDISQPEYLDYIRSHYPADLQKIFRQYPLTEITLFKYDTYTKKESPKAEAI
jgi:hypothetical protein